MSRIAVSTIRDSTSSANCRGCDWQRENAYLGHERRAVQSAARHHAERTGHEVMAQTERITTTYYAAPSTRAQSAPSSSEDGIA